MWNKKKRNYAPKTKYWWNYNDFHWHRFSRGPQQSGFGHLWWNFYFRDLHISMGLKPPKISATLTLPSIISPSIGLKNVFNSSKFSVALVLWPYCPVLSLSNKCCTGRSEDRNRLRDALNKRHSKHWPIHAAKVSQEHLFWKQTTYWGQ